MKAVVSFWIAGLALGLLAGFVSWTVLDIIDPQAAALTPAIAVGIGLATASLIVAAGRKRQVYRELEAIANSPAPLRR
jgi:preprotein translocase subunit Sec61beta